VDVAFLAELDQVVEQGARHQCPQVAPHMQVGLEPTGVRLGLEAQGVALAARNPVIHICPEAENTAAALPFGLHLHGGERRVVHRDADLLHRGLEEVLLPLAPQHRGEQLHQRGPPDRRLEIEPGPIRRDAHVEIAAEWRIPQMHGRRAALAGALCRTRDRVQTAGIGLLSSHQPGTLPMIWPLSAGYGSGIRPAGRAIVMCTSGIARSEK
jgi:hypothetical protein